MEKLSNFRKIQVILLALIIVAGIILITVAIKSKNKKNYGITQTTAQIEDTMNIDENNTQEEMRIELENNQQGDVVEENPEDTSWDDKDAKDTKVDTEEEKKKEKISGNKYYIKINYTANVVTVYTKDGDGNYTVPVKAIVCSTGKATPTGGVYKMSNKYRWHQLNGGVYGQYCSRITGHILFHSVPYAKNTPDSLKYVAYDKLGTKASAGCIRLTCQDAMWIYNNCASGTYVEFYSSSNPGPLGKPSAKKISSNTECRNWDPTDPTKGNPWHTYVEPASTPAVENNTVQESTTKKEEVVKQEPVKQEQNVEIKENTNTQKQNQNNNTNNNTKDEKENQTTENNTKTNTDTTNNTNDNKEKVEKEKEKKKEEEPQIKANNTENNKNTEDEKIDSKA